MAGLWYPTYGCYWSQGDTPYLLFLIADMLHAQSPSREILFDRINGIYRIGETTSPVFFFSYPVHPVNPVKTSSLSLFNSNHSIHEVRLTNAEISGGKGRGCKWILSGQEAFSM